MYRRLENFLDKNNSRFQSLLYKYVFCCSTVPQCSTCVFQFCSCLIFGALADKNILTAKISQFMLQHRTKAHFALHRTKSIFGSQHILYCCSTHIPGYACMHTHTHTHTLTHSLTLTHTHSHTLHSPGLQPTQCLRCYPRSHPLHLS